MRDGLGDDLIVTGVGQTITPEKELKKMRKRETERDWRERKNKICGNNTGLASLTNLLVLLLC